MKIIGYYPGCSLEGASKEYNESIQALTNKLNIELKEVKDWNCCGATAAHSINNKLALALPTRVLALAERQGIEELLVPCAACFNRLSSVKNELIKNINILKEVTDIIEMPYEGKTEVISIITFIEKYVLDKLKENIVKDFAFKTACYYGCLLLRPPKIAKIDHYEDPMIMENIIKQIGAEPIDWAYKIECCGAGFSIPRTDIVSKLSAKIITDAADRGAEVIIVACPMCHSNLDMRQKDIQKYLKKELNIPVIYITQAIGIALGLSFKELGIYRHFVSCEQLLYPKVSEKIN